ncbi:hypothetical protein F5I97DRAFT_1931729 [Phlebopus sp. FC_14]|nr:hypothetical protein F5I97DRAFT_1931729 [Phlebopus sp. FC_14]
MNAKLTQMQTLLLKSIEGKELINTQFFLFSSRSRRTGKVTKPRTLCANDIVIKQNCDWFKRLLGTNDDFLDPAVFEFGEFHGLGSGISLDEYRYGDDSDLEDEDGDENRSMNGVRSDRLSRTSTTISNGITVHTDADADATPRPITPVRYIFIKDTAFQTLAHKLGVQDLQEKACAAMLTHLSKDNIIHELTLPLSSSYPAILEKELDVLFANINAAPVVAAFPSVLERIGEGKLPHGAKMLTGFYQRLLNTHYPGKTQVFGKAKPKPIFV